MMLKLFNTLDDKQVTRFFRVLAESTGVSAIEAAEGFAILSDDDSKGR